MKDRSVAPLERVSFARLSDVLTLPNLLQIQLDSFAWFQQEGLRELFAEISPIEDFSGKHLRLELFVPAQPLGTPKYSELECRRRDMTYAAPLTILARLSNKVTGEIIEREVFFGEIPLMTRYGTFIINGSERVVVSQLVRSPGVYYTAEEDSVSGRELFGARVIPARGAWLDFETSNRHLLTVKVDRKRKLLATTFLRAFAGLVKDERSSAKSDLTTDEGILTAFASVETDPFAHYIRATLERDTLKHADDALIEVYKRLRPGEPISLENARMLLHNLLLNPRRYDLGTVGRYKLNHRLDLALPLHQHTLTLDDLVQILRRLLVLNHEQGHKDVVDHLGNRRVRCVGELLQAQLRIGLQRIERIVHERMSVQDTRELPIPASLINIRPIVAAIREFFGGSQLSQYMEQTNALTEVGLKRRLSALGPGGLSRDRAGFDVRDVHESHYGRICPIETPEGPNIGLIGNLATYARINPFGFIETPYRKVVQRLAVDDRRLIGREFRGVVGREYEAVRRVDGSVLIEAHERIQLSEEILSQLAAVLEGAQVRVKAFVSDEIAYYAADDEERFMIAQANVRLTDLNEFADERVLARHTGEFVMVNTDMLDYIDVSPRQIASVATALIPFLEHDDVNRALMGANMQRQAVPMLCPQSPICGTGMERQIVHDSGQALVSDVAGEVISATACCIEVLDQQGERHSYRLRKFERSNAGTCINQRPAVCKGQRVVPGMVLADGSSSENGELALGQNVLVAFMSWEGGNFEDAILISERIAREDLFTSIHIEKYEIEVRDTKLGPEEVTRDLPNVGEEALCRLDERGIVVIGAEVGPQDLLVGKVTPRGVSELTAEEKLLRAIFGEKARETRDTSLRMPHGEHGKVIEVKVFSREDGNELPPGVIQLVRISIAQKRKIGAGDKMAGRHGNKGVVSRVLPIEDMPFLPDGTPVDIILNPLGVPHRMNIGQIMETHLGWAASVLGCKIASPIFDGATEMDIQEFLRRAGLPETGKVQLYDGRTGEPFDHPVTVGYTYMLKLSHLVEDKVHARSTGPYSLITQQPLGGKAQFGGQRFGEMEVWALEAYGAAHILQEILTVKSDDTVGRIKTYEAIIKGETIASAGVPEAFRVLVKELQSLGMNIEVLNDDDQVVVLNEEPTTEPLPALDINLSGFEDA